jgi:carboxymethylenebutenolidase
VGEDVDACLAYLSGLPSVDAARLGIMGVCLTGRYPITVGAHRDDLRALVVFYGGAQEREWEVNEHQPEAYADLFPRLSAPVLGVFGELVLAARDGD